MDTLYVTAMRRALEVAQLSPDRSTQNAAVIVNPETKLLLSGAPNTYPDGLNLTEERFERPLKYAYIEHAERNSIFAAARMGETLEGTTMVCPWAACADCARAIVQSGITVLIRYPFSDDDVAQARWYESCVQGDTIMKECGVHIVEYKFPEISTYPELLRDGKIWHPNT